ncbi:hypothetical protein BJX70DRAFT_90709 [Aspergillus crustosus]
MGSSVSLHSRDKRHRSNRLSKPPQNQATLCSPSSRASPQAAAQALSLPSTPTAWQTPWTVNSVPSNLIDTVPPSARSQSLSSRPLRRQTTWSYSGVPVAQQSTHATADVWPLSPNIPVPMSSTSKQGSLYGRASFNPSTTATFQPTTLQSTFQSPLIGPPKRSYSVHTSSYIPNTSAERRIPNRSAFITSHSAIDNQEPLPIRRRSLLMRPGVATRAAPRDASPMLILEPCHNDIISPDPIHIRDFGRPPFLTTENVVLSANEPFPQLRPLTPGDFEYTHLGALELGSLRVVNGSASPCSIDRPRLDHACKPAPDATLDSFSPPNLLCRVETRHCMSRPMSSTGLNRYANYEPIKNNLDDFEYIMHNQCSDLVASALISCHQNVPARHGVPGAILKIPPSATVTADVDFPPSPFSFEKSPTSTIGHSMTGSLEADDEALYICEKTPGNFPERHLSYSSCASSYRKLDSGYSSATSHRASIDSHASLRRSSEFHKLVLGGSSRDAEIRKPNTLPTNGNQLPMDRHLNLHDQRPIVSDRPMTMFRAPCKPPQLQANSRPRGSSLPLLDTSGYSISPPLYCDQLRSRNAANPDPCEVNSSVQPRRSEPGDTFSQVSLKVCCKHAY